MARPELLDSDSVEDGGDDDVFEFRVVEVDEGDFMISNSKA